MSKADLYADNQGAQTTHLIINDPTVANLYGLMPVSHGQGSFGPGLFFVRTDQNQGDSVWIYQIDNLVNSGGAFNIFRDSRLTSSYVGPADAPQLNSIQLISCGKSRIQDAFLLNDIIHFVYAKRNVITKSDISYNRYEINTGVLTEKIYSNPSYACTYPSIASLSLVNK